MGCRLLSPTPDYATTFAPKIWRKETIRWLIRDGVGLHNIERYARNGVAAVCIGGEPIPHVDWSAADLITRARQMRKAWESGRAKWEARSDCSEQCPQARPKNGGCDQ